MNRQLLSPEKAGGEFAEPTYDLLSGNVRNFKVRPYEFIFELPLEERPRAAALSAMEVAHIIPPKYRLLDRLDAAKTSHLDNLNRDILLHEVAVIDLNYAQEALKIISSYEHGLAHLRSISESYLTKPKLDPENLDETPRPIAVVEALSRLYDRNLIGSSTRRHATDLIRILLAREHNLFGVQ